MKKTKQENKKRAPLRREWLKKGKEASAELKKKGGKEVGILQEGDRILLKLRKLFETFLHFFAERSGDKKRGGKVLLLRSWGKEEVWEWSKRLSVADV